MNQCEINLTLWGQVQKYITTAQIKMGICGILCWFIDVLYLAKNCRSLQTVSPNKIKMWLNYPSINGIYVTNILYRLRVFVKVELCPLKRFYLSKVSLDVTSWQFSLSSYLLNFLEILKCCFIFIQYIQTSEFCYMPNCTHNLGTRGRWHLKKIIKKNLWSRPHAHSFCLHIDFI